MTRIHLVIRDSSGTIVGQFDLSSQEHAELIKRRLPSDLSVMVEREVRESNGLEASISALSSNVVEWDDRLLDI